MPKINNYKNTKLIDISGNKYGRLLVVSFDKRIKSGYYWKCLCDCGNQKSIVSSRLKNGETQSCGCLHKERTSAAKLKHGCSIRGMETPEYRSWTSMKTRCYDVNSIDYKDYGGRGIKVCERWKNSFQFFLDDMGKRPSLKHSLDRVDNNGDYKPSNCKWSTNKEQSRNRRSNILIEYLGKLITVVEYSEKTGISKNAIYCKLSRQKKRNFKR